MPSSIVRFFNTLFLGHEDIRHTGPSHPEIQTQALNIIRIWRNKHYKDFGMERLIRLFLVIFQFAFPGLYIRHIFGKLGLVGKKIGTEIYVVSKLLFPLVILK